jgi:LysR family hydrogen peroxide-inducible transcriptional activator
MAILPNLQQRRFLWALAEQCHFGRAAESCAVRQSTLSGGIKELEARLGVTLFDRSHRHLMLTPLGKRDRGARPAPVSTIQRCQKHR